MFELKVTRISMGTSDSGPEPMGLGGSQDVVMCWGIDEHAAHMALVSMYTATRAWEQWRVSMSPSELEEIKLKLVVMHTGLGEIAMLAVQDFLGDLITQNSQVFLVDCSSALPTPHPDATLPKAAFLRLLTPFIAKNTKALIYLDADTYLKGSFRELVQISEGLERPLAAVPELSVTQYARKGFQAPNHIHQGDVESYLRDYLGVSPTSYIQSGVLVFAKSFTLDLAQKALDLMQTRSYWFNDQCLLSSLVKGDFYMLPGEWNFQVGSRPIFGKPQDGILHLSGLFRPWRILWNPSFQEYNQLSRLVSSNSKFKRPSNLPWHIRFFNLLSLLSFRAMPEPVQRIIWIKYSQKRS
jgi:lipopolysaccharide biosynthesis glycosyltransferase